MRRRRSGLGATLVAVGLSYAVSACDGGLLSVDEPGVLPPDRLSGPAGAAALRAGALGDFALAYGGDGGVVEGQILVAGLLADEFVHSGTFASRVEYDRRAVSPSNPTATRAFANLQRARRGLETAAVALQGLGGADDDPRVGEMWAVAGFTYVLFGEHYCSGVPFSEVAPSGAITFGEPHTTEQIFERALDRFDHALEGAAGDERVSALARVGRARALLGLGRWAEAAASAAAVPIGFDWAVEHSDRARDQENAVHAFARAYDQWSVADAEGGVGLRFREAADVRVPWTREPAGAVGLDQQTPQYDLLLYPDRGAPIPLATGLEARLIEAEAALALGDPDRALALVGDVRATFGLPPLDDPGTATERVDLLFRERAFTLFATGHRLGDVRRLIRTYGRAPETLLPSGPYPKGGSYGTGEWLPVPADELRNPHFTGCFEGP